MSHGYGSGNLHSGGPFGNPAAEAAFTGAGPVAPPSAGASNGNFYGAEVSADPFAFLSSSIGGLSVSDDVRRNGANTTKSPV